MLTYAITFFVISFTLSSLFFSGRRPLRDSSLISVKFKGAE
jgi:hypothetical protein